MDDIWGMNTIPYDFFDCFYSSISFIAMPLNDVTLVKLDFKNRRQVVIYDEAVETIWDFLSRIAGLPSLIRIMGTFMLARMELFFANFEILDNISFNKKG